MNAPAPKPVHVTAATEFGSPIHVLAAVLAKIGGDVTLTAADLHRVDHARVDVYRDRVTGDVRVAVSAVPREPAS